MPEREDGMRHLTTENVLAYLDGQAGETEQAAIEAHLSACAECSGLKKEMQELESLLYEQPSLEPPEDFVQAWKDVFPAMRGEKKLWINRIISDRIFDTFDQQALAGVRGHLAPPRQLIYSAGKIDIDLRITPAEIREHINVEGQILSSAADSFDNATVQIESAGGAQYETRTNQVGEFSFEVPKDRYHLSVELPHGRIRVLAVP